MRLTFSAVEVLRLPPGPSARPTQNIPICAPKTASCINVESLSPLGDAELVNPAANLSFHACTRHFSNAVSKKALKTAAALPMYVAHPKAIASDASSLAMIDGLDQRPSR